MAVNKDGMSMDELVEIQLALEDSGVYRGGGGAAAEYELRLSPNNGTAFGEAAL